jgi:hypothetical protein
MEPAAISCTLLGHQVASASELNGPNLHRLFLANVRRYTSTHPAICRTLEPINKPEEKINRRRKRTFADVDLSLIINVSIIQSGEKPQM